MAKAQNGEEVFTRLPPASDVQGIVRDGDEIAIQWLAAHNGARAELRMPLLAPILQRYLGSARLP